MIREHPRKQRRKPMNKLRSRRRKRQRTETEKKGARVKKPKSRTMNNQERQASA